MTWLMTDFSNKSEKSTLLQNTWLSQVYCQNGQTLLSTNCVTVSATSQKEKNERIPFTVIHSTMQPEKHPFWRTSSCRKMTPETSDNFFHNLHRFHRFKREEKIGNFLVVRALKPDDQPGSFKYARTMQNCRTSIKFRDPKDLLKSPIISHIPPLMLSTLLVLYFFFVKSFWILITRFFVKVHYLYPRKGE